MLEEYRQIQERQGRENVALWRSQVLRHFEVNGYPGIIYKNENGNLAIDRKVLAAFKRLTPFLVYDRYFDNWRLRTDPEWQPGRGQW